MANEIIWYDESETGIPVLNNVAGSLIAILDACLVTGFNNKTLTSVVVTSAVAVATVTAHGYGDGKMVDIAGAGNALINGRKKITFLTSSTFSFPAPGVADGSISGTITAKRSPLGWTRLHAAAATTGLWSRSDVTATTMSLRIDDTAAGNASVTQARALMVESYTDINTFTGLSPTAAVLLNGQYWSKGANTVAAKAWVLVGDSKTFYLFTDSSSYPSTSYAGVPSGPLVFGDIKSYKNSDPYACIIAGNTSSSGDTFGFGGSALNTAGTAVAVTSSSLVARAATGLGANVGFIPLRYGTGRFGGQGPIYPSPIDNGLEITAPVLLADGTNALGPIRGEFRGIGDPQANLPIAVFHKQVLSNLVGSSNQWLMVGYQITGSPGHLAFDITGPWV